MLKKRRNYGVILDASLRNFLQSIVSNPLYSIELRTFVTTVSKEEFNILYYYF